MRIGRLARSWATRTATRTSNTRRSAGAPSTLARRAHSDIAAAVAELDSWKTSIAQLIQGRPVSAYTIEPEQTVFAAVQKMVAHNTGSLAVVRGAPAEDALQVMGIITERDYLRKIITQSRASKTTRVRDIMSEQVVCVTPQHSVGDALLLMVENDFRHVPVVAAAAEASGAEAMNAPSGGCGALLAMVSMRDLMRRVAADHQRQIDYLTAQLRRLAEAVANDVSQ